MSTGISREEKNKEGGNKCKVRRRSDQRETTLFPGFLPGKRSFEGLYKNTFSPVLGSKPAAHFANALFGHNSHREGCGAVQGPIAVGHPLPYG